MREINVSQIHDCIKDICGSIAMDYAPDIVRALQEGRKNESDERSVTALDMLLENAEIAHTERIPICQDTGMVTVWLKIGQEVHFVGGDLNEAIHSAVAESYTENYLRASVVDDPVFDRKNTKNNAPAIIYAEIVPGDRVTVEVMAKGFGSENMSRIKMLKPAEGIEGIKQFVLETIQMAGPNACPPMIVGVGIGGTFDYCAYLSKKAMMRPFGQYHPDERYASVEKELLEKANALMIGPMGLHGKTTALNIAIETYPTHIAGMPCAVNICCHACRHQEVTL